MHAFITQDSKLKVQSSIDTLVIEPDTSVGIDLVRQIHRFLTRKPIRSERNTVIVSAAHLLTVPAQNALLKILEEPPGNSLIYLVTDLPDLLLPTVLSRCRLEPIASNPKPDPESLDKSRRLLDKLLTAKRVGDRLSAVESAALPRPAALEFLDHLELILHTQIQSGQRPTMNYEPITQTRKYLKANCSVKLCLDYLSLNL